MNVALSAAGRAKQTAKGAIAANPTSWFGASGKLVPFDVEQGADEIPTGLAAGTGEFRDSVAVGGDWTSRAFPLSIGEALLAVLGNVQTTGAEAPYTHVFTLGDAIPYFTIFGQLDNERRAAGDCKLDELQFKFDGNKPIETNETWGGCVPSFPTAITIPGADERLSAYFSGGRGQYKVTVLGDTPIPAKALNGTLVLKRAIAGDIIAGTIVPDDVHEGSLVAEVEMAIRVPNLEAKRTILTGSPSGTEVTPDVVYGSFEWLFTLGAASLKFEAPRVPFNADDPEGDAKGGPATLTLKGGLYIPAGSTTNLTATLVNTRAEY